MCERSPCENRGSLLCLQLVFPVNIVVQVESAPRGEVPFICREYGSAFKKPGECLVEVLLWILNFLKRAAQWEAEESAEGLSS